MPESAQPPARAGIYCRMSLAVMNDPTKVEDQARVSRDLAARLGWTIAEDRGHPEGGGVYTDNSRSAWQKTRKRPAWDRMLADVDAGRLDGIVVYHGDRLVRQPYDLETLIQLADGKGLKLAAPTGMRSLDNTDDRFVLRILVAQACMESDNTSRRRKSQYERWRREGKVRPGGRGGRAFGFRTDGVTHIPAETALIRGAAERILAGRRTSHVAAWLNEQGAVTPAGGPFTHGTVRKMLARPRYAGLMPDGASAAAWEPVLDRETWEQVRAVLEVRAAGFAFATNARRYLLSGIARCSECGSGLQIRAERNPALSGYGCVRPGCRKVQRSARLLDDYVTGFVIGRLAAAERMPRSLPRPGMEAEFRELARQRAETEAMITDHSKGGRLQLLMARLDSIDRRLAQLRDLSGEDARARLIRAHAGITREEFRALPLEVRRSLVTACVTVTVRPASRRGPGLRTQDVDVIPR